DNVAVSTDMARAPERYRAAWSQFDNATGDTRPLSETQSAGTTLDVPASLPRTVGSYVQVDLSAESREHPTWAKPVRAYFRRETGGWKLVGLERVADTPPVSRKG